jgi:hypothetical protein
MHDMPSTSSPMCRARDRFGYGGHADRVGAYLAIKRISAGVS